MAAHIAGEQHCKPAHSPHTVAALTLQAGTLLTHRQAVAMNLLQQKHMSACQSEQSSNAGGAACGKELLKTTEHNREHGPECPHLPSSSFCFQHQYVMTAPN